jgi:hypothetical protein
MKNSERIEKIFQRLATYQYTEGYDPGIYCFGKRDEATIEDITTSLGDAMCDLMHLCDEYGIEFDEIIRRGRYNYEYEKDCPQCAKEKKTGRDIAEHKHDCANA